MDTNQPPPAPPRAIPFWAALKLKRIQALVFLILLPLALIQGAIFLLVAGGLPPGPDAVLDRTAAHARGGRLLTEPYASSSRYGGRRPLVLEFAFQPPNHGEIEASCFTFDRHLARSLADQGQGLAVEFDPNRPRRARLAGTRANLFPNWLFLLPALELALALGVGLWWWQSAAALHRLLVHGHAYRARVVELRPMRGVNPPPMVLHWKLEEPDGVTPAGFARLPRRHPLLKNLSVGSPLWVVADETGTNVFPYLEG